MHLKTLWWKFSLHSVFRVYWTLLSLFHPIISFERVKKVHRHLIVVRNGLKISTTNLVHPVDADACGPPCIIVSNTTAVIALDPANGAYQPVVSGLSRAIAVDVHATEGLVFWSDVLEQTISRANIDGMNATTIIKVQGVCDGLAVEWMSNLLYWTDLTHDVIEVAQLDGSNRRVLISLGLDQPRGLVVDPRKGYE